MNRDDSAKVPMAALMLGASGLVLPVVAIVARLGAGYPPDTFARLIMLMAFLGTSLILSFLGGIWWGVAIGRGDRAVSGGLLALAILPTIVALLTAGLSGWLPRIGAALLGVAIIATLPVDRALAARGLVPVWWLRLRVPLSAALGLLTIGMALLM